MAAAQEYAYTLKPDKLASYSRISLIFFAINIACLLVLGLLTSDAGYRIYALSGGALTLLWVIFVLLRGNNGGHSRLRFTPGYAFLLFLWLKLYFYWVAAIVLLLALLDYIARRPLVVRFTPSVIYFPSFPPRQIAWAEVQNVVLKDGLLTIDFTNNKMLQAEVEDDVLSGEEEEFNGFAGELIRG
jgi:hypothetical protein